MKESFALFFIMLLMVSCSVAVNKNTPQPHTQSNENVITGAERTDKYVPILKNKNIAVAANHTSTVGGKHLVDTLLGLGVEVKIIFSPEHGFRGDADAGADVAEGVDLKTGITVVSLYGKKKKPEPADLVGIDLVVFDIQDVGVRFYTYISTMTYIMEACAESGIPLIILDRPNPNGFYVDGPVLATGYESFVGLHPVPVVYGMTIGEYAMMVNGEGWLKSAKCDLRIITLLNYTHSTLYKLPVKPSPNLPTMESVYLYPSLCFFEGTMMSVGRGTTKPFQWIGHPDYHAGNIRFTPKSTPGSAINPVLIGKECKGFDYTVFADTILKEKRLLLEPLIQAAGFFGDNPKFFNNYFNTLAGSGTLQQQIKSGLSYEEIKRQWDEKLRDFHRIRKKYLLYPD